MTNSFNSLLRLAIISTHPIQYYAPLFRLLNERKMISPRVFFTWSQSESIIPDRDFGRKIQWDIPLFEGYDHVFVRNVSPWPGVYRFFGLINPSLISVIEAFKPEAILVIGWDHFSHLKVMRHFNGKIPVYFRGDSTLLDEKPGFKKILRRLALKWVYSFVDKAFYVGIHNKAYFLAHGLKEEQLFYAPNAVDNEFFMKDEAVAEAKAREWRKELDIGQDDFVFLYAGKFEPRKNLEILINAFIRLQSILQFPARDPLDNNSTLPVETSAKVGIQQINNATTQQFNNSTIQQFNNSTDPNKESPGHQIHLVLVGNGILESGLKNLASGNPAIHFLPFQNQSVMPVVYRLGNIFCLTSCSETWGLAVNEALACGRPVIVSNKVGCAIDLVKSGWNGFIFPHDSIDELLNCLLMAYRNHFELSRNHLGIQLYMQSWSMQECAIQMEKELMHFLMRNVGL